MTSACREVRQGHWVWNRSENLSAHNFLMKTSSRDAPQKFSSTLSKAFKILSHPTPIPIAMLQKWRQCFIFCVIVCPQLQCNLSTCLNLVEGLLTLHEKIWSDFSSNIHESTRETNSGNRKRSFPFKTASLSFWRKTSCSSHRRWWYAGKKGKETMMKISFPEGFVHYPLHLAAWHGLLCP